MSEERPDSAPTAPATTAGGLLRQARQAQGMHIAVLAAAIKVPQRKLEALEGDRLAELPDATFTRALAQTVCRTLKIDPAPVLALLPPSAGHRLEHVGEGINAPFRDRPGQAPGSDWSALGSPAVWAPVLVLLLAALVYFLPPGLVSLPVARPASTPATTVVESPLPATPAPVNRAASEVAAAASAAAPAAPSPLKAETANAAPAVPDDAASVAAIATTGVLMLRASADSWVEVLDGRGQTLLSRLMPAGETVGLDGVMPLKVTIGNAGATQVIFRGRPLDLGGATRDNVARLNLR
jgi:cytoskeleton protein RodZ